MSIFEKWLPEAMRKHWNNCITHFDNDVDEFVCDYFADAKRKCLLVAAAGFDPRSQRIAGMLADVLGERLQGLFIREDREAPATELMAKADENEATLLQIVPASKILHVEVFSDDGAAVGGTRIVSLLDKNPIHNSVTDVVLDMSALSIGIGFPAAYFLLSDSEATAGRSFHLMIASNPELDDLITSEPSDRSMAVRGFAGAGQNYGEKEPAAIWIPHLAHGRTSTLAKIGLSIGDFYKICPVVPFPARDPRRADNLLAEYESEIVNDWEVDPRDIVYVSERNPLDCYRTLSTIKERFVRAVDGTYEPRVILSPMGSKVMAAGALMAAIEHEMTVQYIETERYLFNNSEPYGSASQDMLVHVLLSGPAYSYYDTPTGAEGP